MTVTILEGQEKAVDQFGHAHDIEGLEITRNKSGVNTKVVYDRETSFYRAVAAVDTTSSAYKLPSGKIMLT